MIQFNLLPDVKLEYIKARRARRTAMVISLFTSAAALFLFVLLLLVVNVFQKQHLRDLSADIKKDSQQLQQIPDINRILTVQNQLQSLPALHNQKPVASRLFGYLAQLTPINISIAKLDVDFSANTMEVNGASDSIESINKFTDTLKFTTYSNADATKQGKAFSGVVLSSFDRDSKGATYTVKLNYDPAIFDSASDVNLTVPQIITTRSETEKPSALFQQTKPAGAR